MLGRVAHQAAPTAADIEQPHTRPQLQFAADQIKLGLLGLLQSGSLGPIATAVGHGRIEHGLVEIVAEVVMHPGNLPGTGHRLQVEQTGTQRCPQPARARHLMVQTGTQGPADESVDLRTIPPPLHIGLTQGQAASLEDLSQRVGMVNLQVPGPMAPQADVGPLEQGLGTIGLSQGQRPVRLAPTRARGGRWTGRGCDG